MAGTTRPEDGLRAVARRSPAAWQHRRFDVSKCQAALQQLYVSFVFLSGNERTRLPVAANTALRTAGAATLMVGSPTPPQKPPDGITMASTLGKSSMRII